MTLERVEFEFPSGMSHEGTLSIKDEAFQELVYTSFLQWAVQPIDGCMHSPTGTIKQSHQVFRLNTTNPEKSVQFFQNISVFPCSMILVFSSQVRHSIKSSHLRSHQIPFTSIEKYIPFFYLYKISPSPPRGVGWMDEIAAGWIGEIAIPLLALCNKYKEKDFLGGWTKLLCKVMGVRLGLRYNIFFGNKMDEEDIVWLWEFV